MERQNKQGIIAIFGNSDGRTPGNHNHIRGDKKNLEVEGGIPTTIQQITNPCMMGGEGVGLEGEKLGLEPGAPPRLREPARHVTIDKTRVTPAGEEATTIDRRPPEGSPTTGRSLSKEKYATTTEEAEGAEGAATNNLAIRNTSHVPSGRDTPCNNSIKTKDTNRKSRGGN